MVKRRRDGGRAGEVRLTRILIRARHDGGERAEGAPLERRWQGLVIGRQPAAPATLDCFPIPGPGLARS